MYMDADTNIPATHRESQPCAHLIWGNFVLLVKLKTHVCMQHVNTYDTNTNKDATFSKTLPTNQFCTSSPWIHVNHIRLSSKVGSVCDLRMQFAKHRNNSDESVTNVVRTPRFQKGLKEESLRPRGLAENGVTTLRFLIDDDAMSLKALEHTTGSEYQSKETLRSRASTPLCHLCGTATRNDQYSRL